MQTKIETLIQTLEKDLAALKKELQASGKMITNQEDPEEMIRYRF